MHVWRAAVRLQLVAEIADEAAHQPGREVGGGWLDRVPCELAGGQVEDRGALGGRGAGAGPDRGPGLNVVFEHAAPGAGAGAEEGAPGGPRRRGGGVEPEGGLGMAQEPFER